MLTVLSILRALSTFTLCNPTTERLWKCFIFQIWNSASHTIAVPLSLSLSLSQSRQPVSMPLNTWYLLWKEPHSVCLLNLACSLRMSSGLICVVSMCQISFLVKGEWSSIIRGYHLRSIHSQSMDVCLISSFGSSHGRKWRGTKESWWAWKRRVKKLTWNSTLKKTKITASQYCHFTSNG